MRVGIDARMIRVSGIGRYTEELVGALSKRGVDITIMLNPRDIEWWQAKHGQIRYLETPEAIYSWSEQLILPARIRKENFDLVHFTNFNVPLGWQRPFVMTVHDLTPLSFGGERRSGWISRQAYGRVLRSALNRAKKIIVPSHLVKKQLGRWVASNKINKIPHALNDFFSEQATSAAIQNTLNEYRLSEPFILYVGNLRNHKNVITLLQAFALLKEEQANARLVLVGPNIAHHTKALGQLLNKWHLNKSVLHLTDISDQKLRNLYAAAELFVLPSFMEGYGLVALEAAAQATPVIASQTTPVREFLGQAVFTFDPREPEQLAETMLMLLHNKKMNMELGSRAQKQVLGRTWQDVAGETLYCYQEALANLEVS